MIFLLLIFGRSATSVDLIPPFYLKSNNVVGTWQFSGASIIYEDFAILSPPLQYHKGCAWCMVPPPSKNWSIYFHLNISDVTGGGGFGIWLINEHGADGTLYGGPNRFNGVCLIGFIYESTFLKLKLIESNGSSTYTMEDTRTIEFDYMLDISNHSIILCFEVFYFKDHSLINISHLDHEINQIHIISKNISVSLSKTWLGITASNGQTTSSICLLGARFSIYDIFAATQHGRQKPISVRVSSPHFTPQTAKDTFRNPVFERMTKEITSYKESQGLVEDLSKSADDVLSIIDECNYAFEDIVKYKDLCRFVDNKLKPYAQTWHKRTFKMISTSQNVSKLFNNLFNQTNEMINIFNTSISSTLSKTKEMMDNFNDEIINNISQTLQETVMLHLELQRKSRNVWTSFLKHIAVFEIIIFGIYLYIQSKQIQFIV